MTRKEQIAKKAARAAALATYNAILNPPVWKVAGTSFKTSPAWEDIAKAAAAASYSAVLKMAGDEDVVIKQPLVVKGPKKPGVADANDFQIPADVRPDLMSISVALNRESPMFANYIRAGAPSNSVPLDAKNFIDYIKGGVPKEAGETWVKPSNLVSIIDEILRNVDSEKKDGLKQYLLSL
jgi:hypothetical protein